MDNLIHLVPFQQQSDMMPSFSDKWQTHDAKNRQLGDLILINLISTRETRRHLWL